MAKANKKDNKNVKAVAGSSCDATKDIVTNMEGKMHKSVDALKVDLASLRAGRATPALLDKIMVDYYGSPTPINQVASVTVPEPRMIVVQPWEKNMLKAIEKAKIVSYGRWDGNFAVYVCRERLSYCALHKICSHFRQA